MPRSRLNKAENTARAFSDMVRGELARQRLKRQGLADYMGMTPQAVGQKLLNRVDWSLTEMVDACEYLNISFRIGRREE